MSETDALATALRAVARDSPGPWPREPRRGRTRRAGPKSRR